MTENLDRAAIIATLKREALDTPEEGWVSDLGSWDLEWSEFDEAIVLGYHEGSIDVGHLAGIVEELIATATKSLIDLVQAAEAAVQRVEDVLSKDAFSVQEDGFCADDLVDCDEIRAALKGPTSRQRLEAEKALRELHEEVWTDDPAPGGFVCKECGVPVESEPCDTIRALDGGEQE